LIKKTLFSIILLASFVTSFSQSLETIVLSRSKTIDINYKTANYLSKASLTFLKFTNGRYGIQFSFTASQMTMSHIYVSNMDSLYLGLTHNKHLTLKTRYQDTVYNLMDGKNIWETYYFLDNSQFELFRKERLTEIFTPNGIKALTLRLKKNSKIEIYETANSF